VKLVHTDRRNDHEVELAVVIGKKAKNVKADKAMEFVAGYCIGLDMTIRGRKTAASGNRPIPTACSGPGW
jgi:2-keto-4-pentenoate hydratase/2-oxohepta-3-ene-1,7-dioic acid hydratase in catechol pathway